MTHIPEVLEVMEGTEHTMSKKNERFLRVPYILAVFISLIFLFSLLVSTFLFYKYVTCSDDTFQSISIDDAEADLNTFNSFYSSSRTKDVRLPTAVHPELYQLKIIPFIWEGN